MPSQSTSQSDDCCRCGQPHDPEYNCVFETLTALAIQLDGLMRATSESVVEWVDGSGLRWYKRDEAKQALIMFDHLLEMTDADAF